MQGTVNNKIVFAITKSNWGGAQRYVHDLATHLKGKYEVVVVSGTPGPLTEKLAEYNIQTKVIPELSRDINIFKEFIVFYKLWKFLRNEKPKILHVNSSKIGGMGALAGRLSGTQRIIFTAHGWAHKEERSVASRRAIFFLHYLTVLLSHKTIAVSDEVKDQMKYPLVYKKIAVVHNGIKKEKLLSKDEARHSLLEGQPVPGPNTLWLGTIAELHNNKGLSYAITSLKNLPEHVSFFIIGDGEKKESLEKLAEKEGVHNRIFFLGYKENAKSFLKAFDIFILPSVKEGFPYAILEAGIAELPVIATNVGGVHEVIQDLKTGLLVQPRRPEEIAQAVEFYLTNTDKKEVLQKALTSLVQKEFSVEKMLEKTLKIYKS
ncbi:hypothetical protein CL654_00450 [bacterium]|nr:hypothetical protein [bacterium]|tara:strand:- start:5284 stop:6411 length:1128 start_codon:yes stop_codon:yes gene_type:complete